MGKSAYRRGEMLGEAGTRGVVRDRSVLTGAVCAAEKSLCRVMIAESASNKVRDQRGSGAD